MTCRDCGAPCDDDGFCIHEFAHRGRGSDIRADTLDRVRRFLAFSTLPDDDPMWMVNGIRLNWGDLRLLAHYETQQAERGAEG